MTEKGNRCAANCASLFGQHLGPATGQPLVTESLVVFLRHELIDMDEVEEAVGAVWEWDVRREEGVVDRREALLAVEDDVLGLSVALVAVNRLAGERREVLRLPLPQQQAADVVVEEDRSHQLADIPRLPFELALEIGNDEASSRK